MQQHFLILFLLILSINISNSKLIDDTEAFVGKLFNFTLPGDAFQGNVAYFNVSEAGSDYLPPWLVWDQEQRSLFGVPDFTRDMFPPDYHISVTAHDGSNNKQQAQQVFTIRVKQEAFSQPSKTSSFENLLRQSALKEDKVLPKTKDTIAPQKDDQSGRIARHLPETCQFDDHMTGLLVFPQSSSANENSNLAPVLFGTQPFSIDSSSSPRAKADAISKAAHIFKVDSNRIRLLDTDYLGHLSYSMRPHLADLSPSPRRLALFVIFGCTDESSESLRQWLHQIPLVQQGVILARDRFGAVDPTLVETRLYRKVLRRRQLNEQVLFADNQLRHTTPDFLDQFDLTTTTTTLKPSVTYRQRTRPTRLRSKTTPSRPTTTTRLTSPVRYDSTIPESTSTLKRSRTSPTPTPTTKATTKATPIKSIDDHRPEVRFNIGTLKCTRNVLYTWNVSKYNFFDHEDGSADKLTLALTLESAPGSAQRRSDWLTFNEEHMQLVGLPTQAGSWTYKLTATDASKKSVSDAFIVNVEAAFADTKQPDHEFVISLNLPYENFVAEPSNVVNFVQKLAKSMQDPDTAQIMINSIEVNPHNSKGMLISWSNLTLLVKGECSTQNVNTLHGIQMTDIFRHRMDLRQYPIVSVQKRFSPKCGGESFLPPIRVDFTSTDASSGASSATSDGTGHWWLATALPAAVILALLLAALLIACALRRRRNAAKRSSEHSLNSAGMTLNGDMRSDYVSKGAPVIFPDEIERSSVEDHLTHTHSPSLLKDERPPLAPPDFALALGGGGNAATPLPAGFQSPLSASRGNRRPPTATADDASRPLLDATSTAPLVIGDENPLYRAPPPFERAAGDAANRTPRPRHGSPQRRDVGYVPP